MLIIDIFHDHHYDGNYLENLIQINLANIFYSKITL